MTTGWLTSHAVIIPNISSEQENQISTPSQQVRNTLLLFKNYSNINFCLFPASKTQQVFCCLQLCIIIYLIKSMKGRKMLNLWDTKKITRKRPSKKNSSNWDHKLTNTLDRTGWKPMNSPFHMKPIHRIRKTKCHLSFN